MAREISNYDDVIDSRDVIERMAELGAAMAECQECECDECDTYHENRLELDTLTALAEEASASPDWPYGEALIRDSYFREYAEQLADDIGAISGTERWPLRHIDREAAARELQQDYTPVDFDGVTYWIRM